MKCVARVHPWIIYLFIYPWMRDADALEMIIQQQLKH